MTSDKDLVEIVSEIIRSDESVSGTYGTAEVLIEAMRTILRNAYGTGKIQGDDDGHNDIIKRAIDIACEKHFD